MSKEEIETFYPTNKQEWRKWLSYNHNKKDSVWVIMYRKNSNMPTVSWSDAVDEALCFGWIDSIKRPIDEKKSMQYFSKRKAKSTWSKINKDKIERLIEAGAMTEAGLKCVEIAKQNGSWTILDEVEALIIPEDLALQFNKRPGSKDYFLGLSKSVKKNMLQWVILAKRPETRHKRVVAIAENAHQRLRPEQFR